MSNMNIVIIITLVILLVFLLIVFKSKNMLKKQNELNQKYSEAFDHLVKLGFFNQDEIKSIIKHQIFHTDEDKMFEKFNFFKERVEYLLSKYGLEKARVYYDKTYWVGMTKEELIDSLGEPVKILNKESNKATTNSYYYDFTIYNFDVTPYKSTNFKMKFVIVNNLVTEFTNMQRI